MNMSTAEAVFWDLIREFKISNPEVMRLKNTPASEKISAIKKLREAHLGMGLKEAKDIVEGCYYYGKHMPNNNNTLMKGRLIVSINAVAGSDVTKIGKLMEFMEANGIVYELQS